MSAQENAEHQMKAIASNPMYYHSQTRNSRAERILNSKLRLVKTADDESNREAIERIKANDKNATQEMFERNMGLVAMIAGRYTRFGEEFLDLVQEGSIALMKAIKGYEQGSATKFSTYASRAIEYALKRYT